MVPTNFWLIFIIALLPLAVGFVYYAEYAFGNVWMREAGLTREKLAGGNMLKILGLTYLFSIILAFMLPSFVVHQTGLSGLFGMMEGEWMVQGSALMTDLDALDAKYGMYTRHLHFGHGALHGGMLAILIILPVVSINSLFEHRSWKYMLIHGGYWFISLALMGGLICQFLKWPLPMAG